MRTIVLVAGAILTASEHVSIEREWPIHTFNVSGLGDYKPCPILLKRKRWHDDHYERDPVRNPKFRQVQNRHVMKFQHSRRR